MKCKLVILAASLSLVTGCSTTSDVAPYEVPVQNRTTYNAAPYGASAQNVETLKSYNLRPVSVGTFQISSDPKIVRSPATASMQCRGVMLVTASPSFEAYIEQAFIEELKLAGIYDASSHLVLTGKLNRIDLSSALGDSYWSFRLTLTNARNERFTTDTIVKFQSSFTGWNACAGIAQEFAPAVQKLITDVIKNPKFREIAN